MLFLKWFSSQVDGKRVSIAVLVVVVLALAAAVKIQNDQLATAKEVYRNPRVVTQTRVVKVSGPIRVVTRIVERPGVKESTTVEERGQVVESSGQSSDSSPISLAVALAHPNPNKWILGVGNRNFSYRSWENYSLWGGREFGPLVIEAGAGRRSVELVALIKFGR